MDVGDACRAFFAAVGTPQATDLVRPDASWEEPPERALPSEALQRLHGWRFAVEDVLVKRNVGFCQVTAQGPAGQRRRGIAILAWGQDERLASVRLDLAPQDD